MEDNIFKIIHKVREALEKPEIMSCYSWFNMFPLGSCMDASILLGLILEQKGFGNFTYTSAKKENSTHSWLENESLLIDITSDQFGGVYPKVMIIEKGVNSDVNIHLGFEVYDRFSIKAFSGIPDIGFYQALSKVQFLVDAIAN